MSPGGVGAALVQALEEARRRGFLGPGPVERHVAHARGFTRAGLGAAEEVRAVDLGSGGGVPGLVLAGDLPRSTWVLVEANQRRCGFLAEAVVDLGLEGRVRVVHDRAERVGADPDHRGRYSTVVARGFGRPAVTAECGAPLLQVGGTLMVSEPPDRSAAAVRWPAPWLGRLGLELRGIAPGPPRIAVLAQVRPCDTRFPRRVGVPAKRPLW